MSYEKVVKGATKVKLAPPKSKYIEPILQTTYSEYNNDVRSVMNSLGARLKDSAWTVVYKSLITIHYMIRDGARDVALEYLSQNARILENVKTQNNPQAVSMSKYARYLHTRAVQYGKTGIDYVRWDSKQGGGRLKHLEVEKGLLRECDSVFTQIEALLRCRFHEEDIVNNAILLTVFRLLVNDLLKLYQVFNEGVINLLEHYFEMSRVDATHALDIYEGFTKQTANVVAFLKIAKHLEHATKLKVPNIKHAPTSLMKSLEDYLNDPDFESNHRQYVAEREARKNVDGKGALEPKPVSPQKGANSVNNRDQDAGIQNEKLNSGQINLIDLFTSGVPLQESTIDPNAQFQMQDAAQQQAFVQAQLQQQQIEAQQQAQLQLQQQQTTGLNPFVQNQGQMQQPQPQQPIANGQFMYSAGQPQLQQVQQPFVQNHLASQSLPQQPQLQQQLAGPSQQQLQSSYTGAGFGGYTADPSQTLHLQQQPQPQPSQQVQLQRSNTGGNPFRQSMLGSQMTGGNPFKRQSTLPTLSEHTTTNNFASFSQQLQPQPQAQAPQPQASQNATMLQRTATNPFARQQQQQQQQQQEQQLTPQSTGGNPFRKSMFVQSVVQQNTVAGYNPTFGGLEKLPTVSIFPQTQQVEQLRQPLPQQPQQFQQQQQQFQQQQPQQNFLI